jgi:hypothetical protein
MRLNLAVLLILAGAPAFCEPPSRIEVFGDFGSMRGGGDEGSQGSAAAYGGSVTIPFTARWAIDVQALTSSFADGPDFRVRRLLLSPGVQYRRGSDRAHWFISLGPGLQRDRSRGAYLLYDSSGGARPVSFVATDYGRTLHWRTGAVICPASRALVRLEFYWANRYVLPNVGVLLSVGLRL